MLLSLGLCLALTDGAYGQRALPGMRSVELRAGMADGWYAAQRQNRTGYYFGAATSRYAQRAGRWVFGAEYLCRHYPDRTGRIPVAQFTAEGGYFYKILTDGARIFYFYLGGSALLGYETVNWGEKRLPDGAMIRDSESFLYGGTVTLEAEAYLTDRIVLSLSGRERVLWGSAAGHFHAQFGLGLKFIID